MRYSQFYPLALRGLILGLAALTLTGCEDSLTEPGQEEEVATLTVDAVSDWSFVALGEPARQLTGDVRDSDAWDIAFFASSVMLNGGDSGSAGVVGHCICQNANATAAQIMAMTPRSELGAFEAVSAEHIPTDEAAWISDGLVPSITGWYRYDVSTHAISAVPERVWKVRTADGNSFAKLRISDIEGASRTNAGKVTLHFATQASAGAPMSTHQTLVVDLSGDAEVYIDLKKGELSDASSWDLLLEGYTIRLNSGVSGSGRAGATLVNEDFAAIDDASDLSDTHYRADGYGGVFDEHSWYRYDPKDHQIWPSYDVYLIRRGDVVYKVQIVGYYNAQGDARHVTFRYARLAGQ